MNNILIVLVLVAAFVGPFIPSQDIYLRRAAIITRRYIRRAIAVRRSFWYPPAALALVAGVWFVLKSDIPPPEKLGNQEYGQYGDSFGVITSLFTALGFGGLITTLLLQQRQIKSQENAEERNRQREAQAQYENVLFRLLEIYRQTLSEIGNSSSEGRDVLVKSIERVESNLVAEGVQTLPAGVQGRSDSRSLTEDDHHRIEYLHFRNFKIVSAEINPQGRLVDTFETLLRHMVGAPDHLLIHTYRDLVFAQITYIELKYFFLVALSIANRARLRELMNSSGIIDRLSRSSTHKLHRQMFKIYWNISIENRDMPPTMPMSSAQIRRACRAHKKASGKPMRKYTPVNVRTSPTDASTRPSQGE